MNPRAPLLNCAVARVALQTTTDGQVLVNNFDYLCSTGATVPTAADLVSLATAWWGVWKTDLQAIFPPVCSIDNIFVSELHYGQTPSQLSTPPGAPIVGTAGATSLATQLSVNVSRETALKGKHGRGRVQFGSIPNIFCTPATDPDVLNAAGITAYNGILISMATSVIGSFTWVPAVTQKWGAGDPLPQGSVNYGVPVISAILRTVFGTQRRRVKGRGR